MTRTMPDRMELVKQFCIAVFIQGMQLRLIVVAKKADDPG